jgi:hypothetical protein
VLRGAIAPPSSNLAPLVKELVIEKLCEKIAFLFHLVLFDVFIRKMNCLWLLVYYIVRNT